MEDPMSGAVPPRPPSSGPPPLPSQGATLSDNLRVVASRGQVDNARDLLAAGAGFEPDEEGRTALHLAAQQGHTDVCKVLTSHGCEVNAQDTMGYSPLLRASSQGAQDTVHLLLESGCDPDLQDEHGNAAIHEACWNGFSKTAEVLVNFHCNVCLTNRAGFTALHLAAQNGHNECSRVLLYAGCDANMKNNYGDTALHTAARYGHAGVARILISAKCLLSEQNKNGDTALHIASALKRRKIAKILVESGLDTELLNKQGETASNVAERKDHPEIVVIISNFSKPKAKQSGRRHPEGLGVTFKDEIELADGPVVCPEDEPPFKPEPEPKAEKQEKQERRFFFFKKKKKETKDKPSPTTPTGQQGQTSVQGKQAPRLFPASMQQTERQKAAVLGFFSQYVPRDGVQLYRDLAGNVKQGPIGYAPVCQCGPSLKRLESSITDTHQNFHHRLDSSHQTLNQRIHNLNVHVNRQAGHLRNSMRERFEEEHGRCHERISERLTEERMETEFMMGRHNEGMKEEIESWLNDKLASYGHCLDHHHDDTALPPRNLFFDFPTMGRLVRSRSDETLSVSDYSGKNKKKDFYASRQAAMQQIRGWEVPGTNSRGRKPIPNNSGNNNNNNNRRKELVNNNNLASNRNILVSAAEVHHPPPHIRNPATPTPHSYPDHHHHQQQQQHPPVDKVLSPSTNSTTSPDMPAGHRNNYPYHPQTDQRATPTTANDHPDRPRPQTRVSFSPSPYYQHQHLHPHQRQYGENPYHSASPSSGPPKAVLKPGSQYNHSHQHQPNPHPHHSNLLGGGPPNVADPKSVEQEDSSKTAAQLNGRNSAQRDNSSEHSSGVTLDSSSQESKYGSLRNQMKRFQDDYGVHYKRDEMKSPEASNTPSNLPPTYPRPMPRSRSVDNTLEENSSIINNTKQHASGYLTDSGIRPSSRGVTPNRQYMSREQQSPSPGPPPRSATRYRLPETSSGYNSQPPYSRVQSPGGYGKAQPHSILKGGSANTLNTAGTDRHNHHHDVTFSNDIAAQIGLNRYSNPNMDRNPQSVSMYGINSAGKVSPLVYNNETYARIEDFSPGRLDVPSKSDSNILSSSSGNNTPLMDCLHHDSFLSPSASPSPNYIHGSITNKEDSTCSSNQDSGYDSRANRIDGGVRRNIGSGDNSTGTPSSSFSMERNSCVTSNWSSSPINTSTDIIHHDFAKDSPGYPSNFQYDLSTNQRSRPVSEERDASRTSNVNSNSFVRHSGRNFSPFRQGDAIRSHLLPQSQSYSPNNQQRNNNMEENNNSNNQRIYEKVQSNACDSSANRSNPIPQNNNNSLSNTGKTYNGRGGDNGDYLSVNAYSVRNQTAYNYSSGDELYGDRNSIRLQNGSNPVSTPRQSQQNKMSQRSFSPGPPSAHRRFQSPMPQNNPNTPPKPPPLPSSFSTNRTPLTYQGNPTYPGSTTEPHYNNNNQNNDNKHFNNNQRRPSAITSPNNNSGNNQYQNNTTKPQEQYYHPPHQQPPPSSSKPEYIDATQHKVQAHVEGWYQRKLMEAAQRLRENHDYSTSPTHLPPQNHPFNSTQQQPQERLDTTLPPYQQSIQSQNGFRANNNNNTVVRPPPYHSHSFHSRQPSRPQSDSEGNAPQHSNNNNDIIRTNTTNSPFNNTNSQSAPYHQRTPSNFCNSNGGYRINSERTNNEEDFRPSPPQYYHPNSNNGAGAAAPQNGGSGLQDINFVRRGSVTPMRYDPIHGSDV